MLKVLTYINTASLVFVFVGGGLAYFQRDKITDAVLNQVKEQIPILVRNSLPKVPNLPINTGPVLPFNR